MREWNLRIELKVISVPLPGRMPRYDKQQDCAGIRNSKDSGKAHQRLPAGVGEELADNGMMRENFLSRIFACPGSLGGEGIRVGDGHLSLVPEYLFNQEKKGNFYDLRL